MNKRNRQLREACLIYDRYFEVRNINPYFYDQWLKAFYRLDNLLDHTSTGGTAARKGAKS